MNQSERGTEKSERKTNLKPQTNDARKQTAIDCLYSDIHTRSNSNNPNSVKHTTITMDAKTIEKSKQRINQLK